jgi:predicted nucleic-acid-binding protein
MAAIDTNVLVRLIAVDDPRQVAIAEAFVTRGAWVSHVVLAETIWVLTSVYGSSPEAIGETVELLLAHKEVTLQEPDVVTGALNRFRATSGVEFADCLILEIARKAGHLPLGTFDKTLARIDGTARL